VTHNMNHPLTHRFMLDTDVPGLAHHAQFTLLKKVFVNVSAYNGEENQAEAVDRASYLTARVDAHSELSAAAQEVALALCTNWVDTLPELLATASLLGDAPNS